VSKATENPSRVQSVKVFGEWYDLVGGIRLRGDIRTQDWGLQPGFEATTTRGGTILASFEDVEEWGPLAPVSAEETAVIRANIAADEAATFLRRHRIDEPRFEKLYAKQKGICPGCSTPLGDGKVHFEEGSLRHGYRPCSTIAYTY
jgi:hypothetical protein